MWIAWFSCRLPPRSRRWRSVRPDETGIGAHAAIRGELCVAREAVDPGDLADQLRGGQRPEPGSASSCGATCATSSASSS